jgi:chromosome segregation ATPase
MADRQTQFWKAKAAELESRVAEQDAMIASLQSEDTASDAKLDSINKLNAQKIRALMKSIQDLKKENATLKMQNRENKRSELIGRLKQEIEQQDVAITALRQLVNNEDKCDQQIISFLNAGPPRVRVLSREEMKIEIRKLKAALANSSTRRRGDAVIDDLDKLLSPPQEEATRLLDPLHNEKIVELLEEIENMKVELSSRHQQIEFLKQSVKKYSVQLQSYQIKEQDYELTGVKKTYLEKETSQLRNELSATAMSHEERFAVIEELKVENAALKELAQSLQKKLEDERSGRMKEAKLTRQEMDVLRKQLADSLSERERSKKSVSDAERTLERRVTELNYRIEEKDRRIAELETQALEKEGFLAEMDQELKDGRLDQSMRDERDTEIEVLRLKLSRMEGGLPQEALTAEREVTEFYKAKVKTLTLQVLELQEQVEALEADFDEANKKGSALYLRAKRERPQAADSELRLALVATKERLSQAEAELRDLRAELVEARQKEASITGTHYKVRSSIQALELTVESLTRENESLRDELYEAQQPRPGKAVVGAASHR